MKNEIMASEWRSLQICWPGNHFKVNRSKCGLDLLLEKYVFSIYVTCPLFLCLHSIIQAERGEREREVRSHHKMPRLAKKWAPRTSGKWLPWTIIDIQLTHTQKQEWKTMAAIKPWGYCQAQLKVTEIKTYNNLMLQTCITCNILKQNSTVSER